MSSFMKTLMSNLILQSIVLIIVGAILLFIPGITMSTVVIILAFMLAICGIWAIISVLKEGGSKSGNTPTLVLGIALLVVTIAMFLVPGVFVEFMSLAVGMLLVLSGVLNCVRSFQIKRAEDPSWKVSLVISLIIVGLGILLISNPFGSARLFVQILGISLIGNGVADLLLIYWSKKSSTVHS